MSQKQGSNLRVGRAFRDITPDRPVVLNATHTRTGPHAPSGRYGGAPLTDGVTGAHEFFEFLIERIAQAVAETRENRRPAGWREGLIL